MGEYRRFCIEDLERILELEETCFPLHQRWTTEQYREILGNPDLRWWVLEHKGRVVASAFAFVNQGDEKNECHLQGNVVDHDYRGQGVGSRLIHLREQDARDTGCTVVLTECGVENRASKAMLNRAGYEPFDVTPGYYNGVESCIRWRKEL